MHPIGSTEAKEVPISSSPTLLPLLSSLVPSSIVPNFEFFFRFYFLLFESKRFRIMSTWTHFGLVKNVYF